MTLVTLIYIIHLSLILYRVYAKWFCWVSCCLLLLPTILFWGVLLGSGGAAKTFPWCCYEKWCWTNLRIHGYVLTYGWPCWWNKSKWSGRNQTHSRSINQKSNSLVGGFFWRHCISAMWQLFPFYFFILLFLSSASSCWTSLIMKLSFSSYNRMWPSAYLLHK